MERICLDKSALRAVDDYCEYKRIVGDDDGGQLFTPEEYEEYKKRMLPQRAKNRLYVSVGVPGGIDCKLVGPETPCFCSHRLPRCPLCCHGGADGVQLLIGWLSLFGSRRLR
uniref:Protein FAM221A n=1 Tax=Gasterosteus aculeatus aculeatus TaxID=481459 RepID=A0AAQ4NZ63_GASAC